MKKLGFGAIGLIFIAGIYYFSSGATQLTSEIKAQVNLELSHIQTQGFSVQKKELSKEKEHFIISFDEAEKIATFFTKNGVTLSATDAKMLEGLQVGVDLHYLPNIYSAASLDIYPITLPSIIISTTQKEEDKKILAQIEKMLERKTFLMHLAINKMGTGFKGYMKDIDEVIQGEKTVKMFLSKLEFTGDIKDSKIVGINQTLKALSIDVENKFTLAMHHVKSGYTMTGKTPYDYITSYSIEKMTIQAEDTLTILLNDVKLNSNSSVKDGLSNGVMKTKTKNIIIQNKGKEFILDTLVFEMKANNLDIKAFEQLGQIDVENTKELNMVLQELISHGISFEIPTFSIENITSTGQAMGGFTLSTLFNLDKSFNITAVQSNPLAAINALDASLNISLSNELFGQMAKRPEAVMVMMLFQPKDVNGKKVYKVELKDGKLAVNGKKVM